MKNKKKAGKKAKKKGAASKGVPPKKTSVPNSVPSTVTSTSSVGNSPAADVADKKDGRDTKASGLHTSPADSVIADYICLLE